MKSFLATLGALAASFVEAYIPHISFFKRSASMGIARRLRRFSLLPSLPHRFGHISPVPRIAPVRGSRIGRLIVQRHEASHLHFDVSIIDSDGRELFRGAKSAKELSEMFPDKRPKKWIQQPEHDSAYPIGFEGQIKKGYGKGAVSKVLDTIVEITSSDPHNIRFGIYDGDFKGAYAMINGDGVGWMIVKKLESRVPLPKHHFKIGKPETLDQEGLSFEHKADGHNTIIELGVDKNRLWSWRESKRTGLSLNYEDKVPDIRSDVHPEFAGTRLRVEFVAVEKGIDKGSPKFSPSLRLKPSVSWPDAVYYKPVGAERPAWLSGRLNSKPWKARLDLSRPGMEYALVITDVEKWKGKDLKNLPYGEKKDLAMQIAKVYDKLLLPRSYENGREGWHQIVELEHREGLVVKDPSKPSPRFDTSHDKWLKEKQRDFIDARIMDMQPLVRKTGIVDSSMMGVLVVKDSEGRVYEVGTGFSESERRWYARHKHSVLQDESVIMLRYDPKLEERNAVHAPVYAKVHPGKSDGITTELPMFEYADWDEDSIYAMKSAAGWKP